MMHVAAAEDTVLLYLRRLNVLEPCIVRCPGRVKTTSNRNLLKRKFATEQVVGEVNAKNVV